jgi:dTDP-4-dehydrorhamnose 3,5-epimerase
MDSRRLKIPDLIVLEPARHSDERGFFSEIYNRDHIQNAGISLDIVQENFSLSAQQHTVRGLHFQLPPLAQGKLVQVVSGSILDVAVDIRQGSPWFGQHISIELSASNWQQLWVPAGFAHGFCTLEDDTAVIYKVSAPYSAEHDSGIQWNDPDLGIDWPANETDALLSAKDQQLKPLAEIDSPFKYEDQS